MTVMQEGDPSLIPTTEKNWCNNSTMLIQKGISSQTNERSYTANASKRTRGGNTLQPGYLAGRTVDYPTAADQSLMYDKARQDRTAAVRLRTGYASTKDSRYSYLKNKADAIKANECFILNGSD